MTQTKLSEERIKENHVNVDVVPYWKLTSECSRSKCRAFLKLFLEQNGSFISLVDKQRQASKMKRHWQRTEQANQKKANEVAQKMREDWFKDQFNELTQSIQNGDKPWTYEKFRLFLSTVEKPFAATVDGY